MAIEPILKVHPSDDVVVALADLPAGRVLTYAGETFQLTEAIPAKHKFAVRDFAPGEGLRMYGVLVGKASQPIARGSLISTRNLVHAAAAYASKVRDYAWQAPDVSRWQGRTFQGYPRADGRVGTANYWLFVPTVFCENRNLDVIREALEGALGYAKTGKYKDFAGKLARLYQDGKSGEALRTAAVALEEKDISARRVFANIDGIKFLTHHGGCGGTRQDSATLSRLLAAYVNHPNVAGATVLSLGCQHLQLADFRQDILTLNPTFDKPLLTFEQQASGTEDALLAEAIQSTMAALAEVNRQERAPTPLSKLTIGVKCGGSDGFSGISANPAVGYAADLLVALGGSVILAEFPELCGVEQEMADRCVDVATADKFIRLMDTYAAQAKAVGSGFDMNPSPGNIKDGLITDAIKSAGAAKKAGTAPVVDVLDYTEPLTKPGLNLLCTPGNDVEATTGQAGSGANLILFTTGLGTPTGNPVCPVIKVATHTRLAQRMPDIIDIDTGSILTSEDTIQSKGEEILEFCVGVASGIITPKAVALGQDDFIPWKRGVSL